MSSSIPIQVLPKANQFLDMLYDLGHLDDKLLSRINQRLMAENPEDDQLTVEIVRRVAAEVIFDNLDKISPQMKKNILNEWDLIFS